MIPYISLIFYVYILQITFERYFREQEGSQMPPIFKKYYSLAFKYIVFGIYMLLSLVVGTVLMIAFGIITAVTSFVVSHAPFCQTSHWLCLCRSVTVTKIMY